MDKVKKLYDKAIDKYENGHIDEAIDICEEIMSLSMKYKPAINLKGLLYYFKGDLKSASSLWKLNYEVNNDNVAKKYLEGIRDDEERFSMYVSATKLIKGYRIDEALKILMKCKESDYNRINVDNSIAKCYIKLNQYEKASAYINRVLQIDAKNIIANNQRKSLKNKINKKRNNKKFIIIPIIFLILVLSTIVKFKKTNIINVFNKRKSTVNDLSNIKDKQYKGNNLNESKSIKSKDKDTKKINSTFKYDELSKSIDNKDFDKIYDLCNPWKNKNNNLTIKEKTLLVKGEDILKEEGVSYFYNKGRGYLESNKEFDGAISNLQKAYDYGNQSYLYGHVIFMLGVSYQNKKDITNALKCYEEYETKYSKENYIEEVLYRTAILYKDLNLNKSKEYAKKLMDNYPDSEYANSKIKNILNK